MKSSEFIGVDISQASLDAAVYDQEQVVRLANSVGAIRRWLRTLPPACRIGVESTGKLHRLLVREAIAAGHMVYVLNARDLSHYARALGRRSKTDRLDAQLIARYLAHEYRNLHPYQLPTELQTQVDDLIRRRHHLVVSRDAQRQSFVEMSCKVRSLRALLQAFERVIAEIDEKLQALIAQDPCLATHASRLRTVVGFGPLVSTAMAHAITRHPFKNGDAFIAYIGYDPRVRDSGQLRGRRFLSKRGPAELRRLLFAAAMSASRTKLWRPIYERYRARGLSTTATLIIIARKLARIAFAIVRHGVPFQPERVQSACVSP
jgi:transposase